MANVTYNAGKLRIVSGAITAGTANLAAALIITSKSGASDPDLATLAAIDAVGTVAFHTERKTLTSVTVAVDNANDRVNFDCADIVFAAATGVTALAIVIYDKTTDTNDGTRVPICFDDTNFGAGVPLDGGLTVTVPDFLRAL